MSEFSDSVRRV